VSFVKAVLELSYLLVSADHSAAAAGLVGRSQKRVGVHGEEPRLDFVERLTAKKLRGRVRICQMPLRFDLPPFLALGSR
jgi:hypothetical protein